MDKQNLFDFDDEPEKEAPPRSNLGGVGSYPTEFTYRQGLVDQVVRDMRVIEGDPTFHEPSMQFYVDRVVAYRMEIERIDKDLT